MAHLFADISICFPFFSTGYKINPQNVNNSIDYVLR
jgi:hypothetical protein